MGSTNAQTYYYKLTKSIIKGVQNTNVSGGQFVTFYGKQCYESDKFGHSVGNGILTYDAGYSGTNSVYWGACYYSTNAFFKFNSDKSLLNIETNAGKIYVYKRTAPPSGVTTCSLIANRKPQMPSRGGVEVSNIQTNPISIGVNPSNNNNMRTIGGGGNSSGGSSVYTRQQRTQPTRHECPLCNGKGTIIKHISVPTYGNDYQKYCNICGRSWFASSGHTHTTCTQCGGKGYFISQ